jgi:uncharacterized membrane protein
MFLSNEDQHRVNEAITAVECRTSGEIVCVLARASSDYLTCDLGGRLSRRLWADNC